MKFKKIGLYLCLFLMLNIGIASAETVILRPDGQGYFRQWSNVSCPSGKEWQCVDESTPGTVDYLYTNTKNKIETFNFSGSGLASCVINSIRLVFYAKRYSSTRYSVNPVLRINGIVNAGTSIALGSGYNYYSATFSTNPATGLPWTIEEVDNLEAGIKSSAVNYGGVIAQAFVEIDYTQTDSCADTDNGAFPLSPG